MKSDARGPDGKGLAEIARGTGIRLDYLSRLYRGLRRPSVRILFALARYHHITVERMAAYLERQRA